MHSINLAFAKIPIGFHTFLAILVCAPVVILVSVLLRLVFSSIAPFENLLAAVVGNIFVEVLYGMIKLISVKDVRTGKTKRWAIGNAFYFSLSPCPTSIILISTINTRRSIQERGFTCPHHFDLISKQELP